MKKYRYAEENDGGGPSHERWLLTYSDMITLLMIFFIIMYVISSVNQAKFEALADSLNIALEGGAGIFDNVGPSMMDGKTAGVSAVTEDQMLAELQKDLAQYLEQEGLSGTVSLSREERGLVISFQEMILFQKGKNTLTPEAKEIVDKVGKLLKDVPNYIRVEGHTCDLPINNEAFRSNWELASARATTVVHEFINHSGLEPERLSVTAYSEYRPRVKNDSESNRALNRRVDIVVLSSKYADIEPGSLKASPGKEAAEKNVKNIVKTDNTEKSSPPQKREPRKDMTYVP